MKLIFSLTVLFTVSSCQGEVESETVGGEVKLSKEACLENQEYPGCNEYLGSLESDFTVNSSKPLVAHPGEKVILLGENFSDGMHIKVNGNEIPASVVSSTDAFFFMPQGLDNGKVDALVQKYDKSKRFHLYSLNDNNYPLITDEPAQVCVGKKYYNADGDLLEGTRTCEQAIAECTTDGQVGCLTTEEIKGAKVSQISSGDILLGKTVSGVSGSLDLSNLIPGNIASGVTIAGVTGILSGAPPDCSSDGEVGCVTVPAYKAADMALAVAGNIKSGATIAAITGNYGPACSADGGSACLVDGTNYKAAKLSNFVAADIKSSVTIAGVVGSLSDCAVDGDVSCVVVGPTFKAADMANVTAGNIKNGVTIAGQSGDYPSATYPLVGADGTVDLPAFTSTSGGDTYEWFQSDGTRVTGSIQADQNVTPSINNQTFNAGLYRSVVVNGDADLVAAKIKNGVNLFGVAGDYPSATNPLSGSDATADLDFATFNAKVKSLASFEWFDEAGNRYANTGDANITAANIVAGVSIFGTDGSLGNCTGDGQTACITTAQYKSVDINAYTEWDIRKGKTVGGKAGEITFYKNMANTSLFNRTLGTGALAGVDVYDTIDDQNGNGAFPNQNPDGWDQATGANWIMDPANDVGGGGGTPGDNLCSGSEACVFKDQITNLFWARDNGSTYTWENAISQCENLNYGGYTDWRLPTQKELFQAYTDGIWSQKATDKLSVASDQYWSSTSNSGSTGTVRIVYLIHGLTNTNSKNGSSKVFCVR